LTRLRGNDTRAPRFDRSQSASKTAAVGVTSDLIRGDIYFWGSLMAGALLASIPIVIVYVLFLDYYVSGLTAGAVKG
jgi:multiple sugar transport system permease protein